MNPPRERSAIVAAWLEEGPTELPESTRRAIAVAARTTRQSRRSIWSRWRLPPIDRLSLVALAAVAVIVLAMAGLAMSRIAPGGPNVGGLPPAQSIPASTSPSEAPSADSTPIPTTIVVPLMTEMYVSGLHGYALKHPADWTVTEASQLWWPPDWKADASPGQPFDFIGGMDEPRRLRAASAPILDGLPSVNDWIDEFLTFGDPECVPSRERQELISIDGAPGRLRDSCGEIEVTIVVDGRVYMFTLWVGSEVSNGRELFDAIAATIDLRPEDAALPSPTP